MSTSLGDMLVTFSGDASNLSSVISGAQSAVSGFGDSVQSSAGGIGGFFSGIVGGIGDFIGTVTDGIGSMIDFGRSAYDMGMKLLEPDASMEQMQVGFKTLFGSASAANDMLQQISDFAAKTPFQMMDLDTSAAKLKAFGEQKNVIIPDLTAIGDTLSALGETTPAKLQQVVDIFGKIDSQGKLTTGIMTQFSRNGINAWQALSDATGKPIATLQEMVHKGLIPASQATDDLRRGLEKMYGGGMAAQAQTFNGLMSTLKDNLEAAWRSASGPLFDMAKGALTQVGDLIGSKQFQDFATGAGKDIGDTFSQIGMIVKSVFGDLNFGSAASGFSGVADKIHEMFITIQKDLSVINPEQIATEFQALFGVFQDGASIASSIGGELFKLGSQMLQSASQSGILRDVLTTMRDILDAADGVIQTISGDLETFTSGIFDAFTQSGALQSVMRTIRDILPDVAHFITQAGNDINQNMLPPLESLVTNVGTAVKNFSDWLDKSGTAKSAINALGSVVGTASQDIGVLVGWVADLVGWLGGGGAGTTTLELALSAVAAAFVTAKVMDFANNITTLAGNVSSAASKFMEFASDLKGNVTSTLHSLSAGGIQEMKQSLDAAKVSADEAKVSLEEIGPAGEVAASEVTTASTTMEADMTAVSVSADKAALQLEEVGPAALTAEGEATTAMTAVEGEAATAKSTIGGLSGVLGGLLSLINVGESTIQGAGGWTPQMKQEWQKAHPGMPIPTSSLGFASGIENFSGGLAYVHGGEVLANLAPGTNVIPADRVSFGGSGGGQNGPVNIYVMLDSQIIGHATAPVIVGEMRVRTGMRM